MKAVIMAGGSGTRIRSVASDIPKSMIPVLGKSILQYQIENLAECGVRDVLIITGRLGHMIREYFGDGEAFGVHIEYFDEEQPMGTAGALFSLKDSLPDDFLLLMGDLVLSVDFGRFMQAHLDSGAAATLFVHPNSHPYDSDIIVTDHTMKLSDFTKDRCGIDAPIVPLSALRARLVTGFIGKHEERNTPCHNQVNAGIYCLSRRAFQMVPRPDEVKLDLDRDLIRTLIEGGHVYAYSSTEYVKDMGTPERYLEVTKAVENGIVASRNLSRPQRAVFIDRDGTLNCKEGFIKAPGELSLLPGAPEGLRALNSSRYLAVLITNQPVIARGEAGFAGYDEIQKTLETLLGAQGAYIDCVYFCPHHPDSGFEGEVKELKFSCRCRKPEPGLILQAAADLGIDLTHSWMVGDSTMDVLSGERAGVRTIGLLSGNALADGRYEAKPDYVSMDFAEAVKLILSAESEP